MRKHKNTQTRAVECDERFNKDQKNEKLYKVLE